MMQKPLIQQRLAIFVTTFFIFSFSSTTSRAAESNLKYWVSKNYLVSSNINAGIAENFSPLIFDPNLPLSKSPNSADIFICFDNRSLEDSILPMSRNILQGSAKGIPFCEKNDPVEGFGFLSHPKRLDPKKILKGITVSRNSIGKFYCEAIFTAHSFFSLLGNEDLYHLKNAREVNIEPYTVSMFPFGSKETKPGLMRHLVAPDRMETMITTSGDVVFWELSLNNTWTCLAPAYRLFWREAFEKCDAGVKELTSDSTKNEISYSILDDKFKEILSITRMCKASLE